MVRPGGDLSEIEGCVAGDAEDKSCFHSASAARPQEDLPRRSATPTLIIAGSPPPLSRNLVIYVLLFAFYLPYAFPLGSS
jgi:hypothetical protein